MKKSKQEQIEIGVKYFMDLHRIEKKMGALVLVSTTIASAIAFPLTKVVILFILFSFLLYLKFLHDIKQKRDKRIVEFKKEVESLDSLQP